MEQTPEASNSAPGFFPALTHFTGAVDAFPREVIKHFSMFKEVEAKLHDPEFMLEALLREIAQQPITTTAQRRAIEQNADVAEQNPQVRSVKSSSTTYQLTPTSSPRRTLTAFLQTSRL